MRHAEQLTVTTPSDCEVRMTHVFDAPRAVVFEAHVKPELLKRWLGVFGDWTMDVCTVDLRVGGTARIVWRNPVNGATMGFTQTYLGIVQGERIVATEKLDDPWHEGEAVGTLVLTETAGRTTLTNTVKYASKQVRDMVLQTPMEKGVGASYDAPAPHRLRARRLPDHSPSACATR